jgi:hypothetical protein
MVVWSTSLSTRLKAIASLIVSVVSGILFLNGIPLMFIWLFASLVKLLIVRNWRLFFLLMTAVLLPFGGGIGSPIHALFAIIVATFVTPLGWVQAERVMSYVKPRFIFGMTVVLAIIVVAVRAGVSVPLVTRVANPLLAERERTYQLEHLLLWLHDSRYCGREIAFAESANLPIDSVESAVSRKYRPPAAIEDADLYWRTALQCSEKAGAVQSTPVVFTFGGPELADSVPVFKIDGRYGGDAKVWINKAQQN